MKGYTTTGVNFHRLFLHFGGKMEIILNGKQTIVSEKAMLETVLEGFNIARIAVEINGEIVKKSTYSTKSLKEGDQIEVVTFVGGG